MAKKGNIPVNGKVVLLLACMSFLCNLCSAQLCTGALGDPVLNITFGAGANPGGPLAAATTNYTYTTSGCPQDGSYTVTNSSGGCYADTWHTLLHDHTGDPNGYYMLINASYPPGVFYLDTVRGLCGNTTYQFAAWIINLLKPNTSVCGATGIMPNITFSIEKLNGSVIQKYSTGDIAPTDSINWQQYGFYFTTQPNLNEVVIRMVNNAPGGCGNDLAMDDITFRSCGPMVNINIAGSMGNSTSRCVGAAAQTLQLNSFISEGYSNPAYQWERSADSGKTWQDVPAATTPALQVVLNKTIAAGTYLYRLTMAEAQNIGSPGCRVASNIDTVVVGLVPAPVITNNSPLCAGSSLIITAGGGALYNWAGPGNFKHSGDTVVIAGASAANAGKYYVTVVSPQGCSVIDSTTVSVYSVTAGAGKDTTICAGGIARLTASGGQTYTWAPSSSLSSFNISSPLASPANTTTYFVTVGANGCFDTATVTVNVVKKLSVYSNSPVCAGGTIVLAASNAKWYNWAGPGGFTATGDTVKIAPAVPANTGKYYVRDTSDKVCFNYDSVTVVLGNPAAFAGRDTAICTGASVQLKGSGNGSYSWQPPAGLSAVNILNPVASPVATTTYVLTVAQGGCTGTDSVTIAVFNPVQATSNSPLCAGGNLVLQATGGTAYKWAGPGGFTGTGNTVKITGVTSANAGAYFVADTTNNVCPGPAQTTVVVNTPMANAGNDTTVCKGAQLQLNGSGNGTFSWQPPGALSAANIAGPILTAAQTTRYVLTVTDSGCIATDTLLITVNNPITVSAGPGETIVQGKHVMLQGSISDTSAKFYWSPSLYMDNPTSLTPLVQPPVDITYTLHVTTADACGVAEDSVLIKVLDKVVIPNAFSPNGDGINDVWQIQALAAYTTADVAVFNRWGQPVFHSTGYARPWDGTYNGKPLPVATYYYVINLHNNMPVLSGWVVLLR